MESELDKKSLNIQDIQDLINKFDINRERYLNFDEKFKEYLDIQIKNREKWEKIAFVCMGVHGRIFSVMNVNRKRKNDGGFRYSK